MAKNNELAAVIFKHADELSAVPVAHFFVEKHAQTVDGINEAKTRKTELELAKQKFEPLETRFLTRQTALKEAETKLAEFYAPLGGKSFRALLDEKISEQPVFTERLSAHNRAQTLQHERDGLSASSDAGLLEKAKLKAQQLALTGKIKLEERSAGKQEKDIGRQLIENSLEESVRCESTTSIVDQITSQRKVIAERLSALEESQSIKDEVAQQLCTDLSIERIENGKTLDVEISQCDKTVRELEGTLNTAAGELLPELQKFERARLPAELATMLDGTKPQPDDGTRSPDDEDNQMTLYVRSVSVAIPIAFVFWLFVGGFWGTMFWGFVAGLAVAKTGLLLGVHSPRLRTTSAAIGAVMLFFAMTGLIGLSGDIQIVKTGEFTEHPGHSVGEVVDNFLENAEWSSITDEEGDRLVIVGGEMAYDGEPANVLLTFQLHGESFTLHSVDLDGERQDDAFSDQLLAVMYREYTEEDTSADDTGNPDEPEVSDNSPASTSQYDLSELSELPMTNRLKEKISSSDEVYFVKLTTSKTTDMVMQRLSRRAGIDPGGVSTKEAIAEYIVTINGNDAHFGSLYLDDNGILEYTPDTGLEYTVVNTRANKGNLVIRTEDTLVTGTFVQKSSTSVSIDVPNAEYKSTLFGQEAGEEPGVDTVTIWSGTCHRIK